jgi:DNA-binding response OmpR family regulator/predicted ATPase/tetratricopeptide (TPR) repeat protein
MHARIALAEATVDLDARRVERADGGSIPLTEAEARLLRCLVAHGGEPVSRETLSSEALGYSPRAQTRAVDHAMARLRAKVESDPDSPRAVLTVRGVGYRLALRASAAAPPPARGVLARDGVVIDLDALRVRRGGATEPLTPAEAALIGALAPGRALDRATLARRAGTSARGLDTLVYRVRSKIERQPAEPTWLVTERRHGYRLVGGRPREVRQPAAHGHFVGRTVEIAAIRAALASDRLVTIVGVGGVGKSRLAAEVADLRRGAGEAVWLADLGSAADLESMCASVAASLGISLHGEAPDALRHALECQEGLLILDNAERAGALASSVEGWLAASPGLSILVASRAPLDLRTERVLSIPPLDPESASALFLARAQAARAGFDAEPTVVAALVGRVDGLPLAIELAAAQVRVMEPSAVLDRLGQPSSPLRLRDGRGDAVREAVTGSIDLLEVAEQRALAWLSVFRRSFSPDASEAVLRDVARDPVDALRILAERGLLDTETGMAGLRLRLLDPVREVADERLGPDRDAAWTAHGQWFARFGSDEALEDLCIAGGIARRRALQRDLDDLVDASRRAVDRADPDVAVGAALAAVEVLLQDGRANLAVDVARRALALARDGQRTRLVRALAVATEHSGADAESLFREAVAAAEAPLQARARGDYALSLQNRGRLAEARVEYETALRLIGISLRQQAVLRCGLAAIDYYQGHTHAAYDGFAAAAAIFGEVGDRRGELAASGNLAAIHGALGDVERAIRAYRETIARAAELADPRKEAVARMNLGRQQLEAGDLEAGAEELGRALAIARRIAGPRLEANTRGCLGSAHRELGRLDEAIGGYSRAIALATSVGDRRVVASYVANRAAALRLLGRAAEARVGFDEALALTTEAGDVATRALVLAHRGDLRRETGDAGAGADLDEALALARGASQPLTVAEVLALQARRLAGSGESEAANAALDEATALAASIGVAPRSEVARLIARARDACDTLRHSARSP